jgi:hypothetical protein
MSRAFWTEAVVVIQGILIVILFVRMVRVERVVRNMLGGWKRGR